MSESMAMRVSSSVEVELICMTITISLLHHFESSLVADFKGFLSDHRTLGRIGCKSRITGLLDLEIDREKYRGNASLHQWSDLSTAAALT